MSFTIGFNKVIIPTAYSREKLTETTQTMVTTYVKQLAAVVSSNNTEEKLSDNEANLVDEFWGEDYSAVVDSLTTLLSEGYCMDSNSVLVSTNTEDNPTEVYYILEGLFAPLMRADVKEVEAQVITDDSKAGVSATFYSLQNPALV